VSQNLVSLEALGAQVAEETLEFTVVGDTLAAAQPFGERRREQCIWIEIPEDFLDNLRRNRPGNSRRFDLLEDASPSSASPRRLRPGNRAGHTFIVDAALGLESRNGLVYGVLAFATPGQALANLRFGQFA
jgi:hypothetical protein